ncbi:hypothetical protein PRIPAC_74051 [Pristionchus pacificus]|uniref:Uncharacterized protein n=1 Tax=Pristionchus pacificus TaxID=54126 RepID=A0A2A6CSI3_PRIPA|nr:hypothetical protein PRIPAC_74051 [Pristionchus pacificus]|eukprot:PDM81003.1 hypothetical protein PRIPAC_36006 [Pristionchus pacificus]
MIFSQTMSFNSNANNYNPMYGRQESAVSMESLGNVYTEDMKAMLETPLDLSDYLFDVFNYLFNYRIDYGKMSLVTNLDIICEEVGV